MAKKQPPGKKKGKYTAKLTESALSYMDPRLQSIAKEVDEGMKANRSFVRLSHEGTPVVDVIAELKDPHENVPDLRIITKTGNLVTGTVAVENLKAVAAHDNVLRISAGDRVVTELTASIPEIRASSTDISAALPVGAAVPDGSGVIIGIVDYGCDFLHKNFRKSDGSTRVLFLWDQNGGPSVQTPSPQPYNYGREFSAGVLGQAISNETPAPVPQSNPNHPEDPDNGAYVFIGYRPQESGDDPAHGTHVMDIAAGNGRGTGTSGVAPNADIIFVDLFSRSDELLDDSRESFASSTRLIHAVDYIFRKAGELGRPAVVNLSLGTYGGPHDGTRPVDRIFDEMLTQPGRAIVVAAGNSHFLRTHARGQVAAGSSKILTWNVVYTGPVLDNEIEVWYPSGSELEFTLTDPDGDEIGPLQLDSPAEQDVNVGSNVVMRIRHTRDPVNQDNLLNVYMLPNSGLPTGAWKLKLKAGGAAAVPFHAWIDRSNNNQQSTFAPADAEPTHTLGSIACARRTIAVGAYNARGTGRPIASFSSEGPTRDGREKPEISAPGGEIGDGVRAARSLTHTRTTTMAGTSMATPHVTGLVALLMQQAGVTATAESLRDALVEAVRRNPPSGASWDSRYGRGRIDAAGSLGFAAEATEDGDGVTSGEILPVEQNHRAVVGVGDGVLERMAALVAANGLRMRFTVEIEPRD